ncbi:redoxin domain-containing protein [Chitinophaga sp. 22321]|uniref:AhpC/TSA family protein n=1 Tax=Chitinophaga hostae TaxID=2831022 RepID=A0ABS5IZ87_9BACT|nr:TlpA disulfide reductase family protein [Chitinophaga hostae]MBS0027632.1 AhpC/TSA family protein [Chitinophaga hostae]
MKHLLKIAMLLALPVICRAGEGFVIKGNVRGIVSGYVSITEYIHLRETGKEEAAPPRVRIENGEFTYAGKLEHPVMVRLKVSTREFFVYLENTSYTVTGRLDSLSAASFQGGPLNDEFQRFLASGKSEIAYIKENPNSGVSAYLALKQSTGTYEKALAAYDLLGPAARNTWAGKELTATIAAFKRGAAGAVFPNLKLTDANEKAISIKQLKGKIVVLDFWASWCSPCRAYIPTMREHYNKYQPKGVQFMSVSVDENKQKWKDAMDELKMEWTQTLADGAFEDGKGVKELLHIYYIPHVIIVGKDGKIAASLDYSTKDQLDKKLDELLK